MVRKLASAAGLGPVRIAARKWACHPPAMAGVVLRQGTDRGARVVNPHCDGFHDLW